MRSPVQIALWLFILLYIWLFTSLAFAQHEGMRTHKADLGQMDQAVWNSSRGRFLEMTDHGFVATRMTDHVEPILILISPVLWLWDDVRALLLLQVVAVAVGAGFVYHLALRRLEGWLTAQERMQIWVMEPLRRLAEPLALALAIAYLLAPQLQSALLTELHAVPLGVPLILWAFWAVETRRWRQFAVAALLVAAVKEEMALLAAGLGAWVIWRIWIADTGMEPATQGNRQRRSALISATAVMLLSLVWFYIATFVIVPAHAVEVYGVAESTYFQRYGVLGDSPLGIVKSLFTQPHLVWQIATEPARLEYLRGLLAPFGFLSLLAPDVLLISLPLLLANLLSAYPAQYYGEFHYSAPLTSYMGAAAAYGVGRLWRWFGRHTTQSSAHFQHLPASSVTTMVFVSGWHNRRAVLRPLLSALLFLWVLAWGVSAYLQSGRGPYGGRYDPTPITAHHRLLERFIAQIPRDVPLTATAAVHPHVSHRRYVYQFPMGLETPVPAEWALLDVTTATDMAPGDVKFLVEQMLAAEWGVVDAADGFLLLRVGAPQKSIPDAFYDFARLPHDAMPETLSGGDEPGFAGIEVEDWPRWRQTSVVTYWRAASPPVEPEIEIRTPDGETLYRFDDATPPALLWYPPNQWQPGEIIKVATLPLYLPRAWGVAVAAGEEEISQEDSLVEDGMVLRSAYVRAQDGSLRSLPVMPVGMADFASQLESYYGVAALNRTDTLTLPDGRQVTVESYLPGIPLYPGRSTDLWLQWHSATGWPAGYAAFVHLRRDGTNVAQVDGLPRYFVRYAPDEDRNLPGGLPDWRQLQIPDGAQTPGDWSVVIGLYDVQTGVRATTTAGDEVVAGTLHVAPFIPDQSCALIPATCASQPLR